MTITTPPQTLRIEGWRGISHSYALVNQFQMLAFQKQGMVRLQHVDMPFIMAHWGQGQNSAGFSPADQSLLENLSQPVMAQAVYKIYAPLELSTQTSLPTLTFVAFVSQWRARTHHPCDIPCRRRGVFLPYGRPGHCLEPAKHGS
jgi:hypothetical protein